MVQLFNEYISLYDTQSQLSPPISTTQGFPRSSRQNKKIPLPYNVDDQLYFSWLTNCVNTHISAIQIQEPRLCQSLGEDSELPDTPLA